MSNEDIDTIVFRKRTRAMVRFQMVQLASNLLGTGSLTASIIAPIVLTVTRGNPLWLLMFLVWPVCIFVMGMVKHFGFPPRFSALALVVFLYATPAPAWYWFIAISTVLSYHLHSNVLPVEDMKLKRSLEESGRSTFESHR